MLLNSLLNPWRVYIGRFGITATQYVFLPEDGSCE